MYSRAVRSLASSTMAAFTPCSNCFTLKRWCHRCTSGVIKHGNRVDAGISVGGDNGDMNNVVVVNIELRPFFRDDPVPQLAASLLQQRLYLAGGQDINAVQQVVRCVKDLQTITVA